MYFLQEIEGGNGRAEGGQLTVFQPDMVEIYEVSMTETEHMDFLQHLLLGMSHIHFYSIQVFVVVPHSNLESESHFIVGCVPA
jgi:hypothetical protein